MSEASPRVRPDPADPQGLKETSRPALPPPETDRPPARPFRPVPLDAFLASPGDHLRRGPLAIILIEDEVEVAATLAHHMAAGFRKILALSPEPLAPHEIPPDPKGRVLNLLVDARRLGAHVRAVNAVIDAAPADSWLYYGYNAEFLFYPFSESRAVGEMLSFHAEERRRGMLTYVIDLYAPDLERFPDAVSVSEAMFDGSGYYALGRPNRDGGAHELHGAVARVRVDAGGGVGDRGRLAHVALLGKSSGVEAG